MTDTLATAAEIAEAERDCLVEDVYHAPPAARALRHPETAPAWQQELLAEIAEDDCPSEGELAARFDADRALIEQTDREAAEREQDDTIPFLPPEKHGIPPRQTPVLPLPPAPKEERPWRVLGVRGRITDWKTRGDIDRPVNVGGPTPFPPDMVRRRD